VLNLRNLNPTATQTGFTLTELMIAIALGMSVISSVLLGYLATYSGSVNTLANSKLSQEMTTLMNLMVEDTRRAGYSSSIVTPSANPFSNVGTTALTVFDDMTSNTQQAETGSGSCILYSYDRNEDGAVDATELFGFRLNAGVVEMRTTGVPGDAPTCAGVGQWTALTDAGFMDVTSLDFSLAESQCLNVREPDGIDNDAANGVDDDAEIDCYAIAPATGNITVETRQVTINLEAELTNDDFVKMSMTQNVRVRNDMLRIQP
jgi:prepilin peptidase dependent protein B